MYSSSHPGKKNDLMFPKGEIQTHRNEQLFREHRDGKKLSQDLKPDVPGPRAKALYRKTLSRVIAAANIGSFFLYLILLPPQGHLGSLAWRTSSCR